MSSPPAAVAAGLLGSPSRYRHPGDVIRLISGIALLGCSLAASAAASRWLLGPAAPVPDGLSPASRIITGVVQVACVATVALVVAATLRHRRYRLLGGLTAGAAAAAAIVAGIFYLLGDQHPDALAGNLARGSWLASAAFPGPPLIACAAAVVVAASPWLSRPWRRAAWLTLLLVAAARILTGTALPMELILAIAAGVTAGAAVLVAFGVPDRRAGPDEVAAALRRAGVPVESVRPAEVAARGSRPFAAVAADGRRLFVKALGSDQRDADLLYRAYRAVRLRNVGDTRPAASLFHAVERQALVGVMAERAGDLRAQRRPRRQGRRRYRAAGYGMGGRQLVGAAPRRADQRRPARAAMGGGGQATPGGNRPSFAAGRERDGQPGRPAQDRRLQLLRARRHAAPDGPGRGRTARLARDPGRRGPGRGRRQGPRRPGGGAVGAAAATAGPVRRHPPRHRASGWHAGAEPGPGPPPPADSQPRNWRGCSG